jgi:hypothetical protein
MYRIVPGIGYHMTMNTDNTVETDSKHWVDVPGWPRAHITTGPHGVVLVLTDEFEPGLPGGPYWLIVCPWCRVNPVAIPRKVAVNGCKGKGVPSCGCRKPGHENFQGDYRKIRTGDSLFS